MMKIRYIGIAVAALLVSCVSCDEQQNATREARDFTGYSGAPSSYDTYDPASGSYLSPEKWAQPNLLLPSLSGGCGSGSLVKPILAGLVGALLLKLPLLLAAKLLLLKLAVPAGLLAAAAPVLLPLAYMLFNKKPSGSSSGGSSSDAPESRALEDFLASSACLEKIACSIGRSQARSDTVKTFSWMLKSVESMLGPQEEMRSLVGSYRSAYLSGAGQGEHGCSAYQCSIPEFFVRQGFEKLSVNLERTELHCWKTRLSQAEKKKIFQIARLINEQQSKVTPKAKFRKNLEKSIENHMKRMAVCTGKNIRIIRPPPEGLKVLKNGEWVIPKQRKHLKSSEERTKKLLSHVPMTIPEIETKNYKKLQDSKNNLNRKSRTSLVRSQFPRVKQRTESEQMKRFKRIFKNFMRKRSEFMRSVSHLRNELEDIRFEYSATQVISRSVSQMNAVGGKGGGEAEVGPWRRSGNGGGATRGRRRRRGRVTATQRDTKGKTIGEIGSCPELLTRT